MEWISCSQQPIASQLQSFHSLEDEQKRRQLQDKDRSQLAMQSSQRRLKEFKKESALAHGRALFQALYEQVAETIRTSVEAFVCDPTKARIHGAALPYLNEFDSLEQVAGVALITALDQLTRRQTLATFCQSIGKALEDENRLIRLRHRSPLVQRKLFRSSGLSRRAIASKPVMRALACPCPEWNDKAKLQVGSFMLDCMESTGLFRLVKRRVGNRTPYYVEPTEDVLAFIRSCPPAVARTSHGAMICPPRPWHELFGGGLLDSSEPLVRVPTQDMEDRMGKAMAPYQQADMTQVLSAVNALQDVPLLVSGDMTSLLRTAWDNGIDGLFPCSRVPMEMPERLGSDPSLEALKERNRLAAMAHRDREKNRGTRVKVERAIQHAEALADCTIWQAYQLDHRGRAYTVNRYVTHQGPDYEKSLLTFPPEPVGPDGIDWILKAAAGHYGLSRSSWADRLQWGQDNRQRMLAAAEDPLGRLELWRSAKDPWQYLQTCKGLKEALETGSTGVPIRLDQTTSGLGILSAMTRQKGIARLCNVWGSTPKDLYSVVADRVIKALQHDMEFGETDKERSLSALWLNYGITRSLVKGPVLAVPYGGRFMSVSDMLVDVLDAHYGYVPLEEFNYRVATPAKYLAGRLWHELSDVVQPCMVVKKWLYGVVNKCMNSGHPVEWTSPTGFPMRLADRMLSTSQVPMLLYGKRRVINFADALIDAKLNPQAARKAACANLVHSMDAALLIATTNDMARLSMPLLTNHDCFATTPLHATGLHDRLLWNFTGLYRTDWLAVWKEEIESRTGVKLPKLPAYGELEVGLIGSNPYVFS